MALADIPRAAGERESLDGMLAAQRAEVRRKCTGLAPEHRARTLTDSGLTVPGILKHLSMAEEYWFDYNFLGNPKRSPWNSVDWDADPDWEFRTAPAEDIDDLLVMYDEACARSTAIVAAAALDDLAARLTFGEREANLRFIVLHMIEETARHLGHLDLLREACDGSVG